MAATTLRIEKLGHRGEGMAQTADGPVFVPLTLPGETVAATLSGNRGDLVEVITPSPERRAAPCPHFGRCGGCQLQHLSPRAYEGFKHDLVATALARAGVEAKIAPLVCAQGRGRRRATLHARGRGAGFMALRSHQIHPIDRCPILVPELDQAPHIAQAIASAVGPCDVAFTASAVGLDVAIRAKGASVSAPMGKIAERFGLARLSLNGEPVIVARPPVVVMGRAEVPMPLSSFLQATEAAEAELASRVTGALKGAKSIADLFCGVGPFALRLAERAPVFAADSDKPAIEALDAAQRRAKGLKPITAERRDLFGEPLGPFELNRFDAVVIDPPRAGALAQVRELARSKVKTIAYVSCDPSSFARDAAVLVAGGYRMSPVTPIDQFAYSAHTEVLAIFNR